MIRLLSSEALRFRSRRMVKVLTLLAIIGIVVGAVLGTLASKRPTDAPEPNWLPTPASTNFVLTWRSYGPDNAVVSGSWFPPQLVKRD